MVVVFGVVLVDVVFVDVVDFDFVSAGFLEDFEVVVFFTADFEFLTEVVVFPVFELAVFEFEVFEFDVFDVVLAFGSVLDFAVLVFDFGEGLGVAFVFACDFFGVGVAFFLGVGVGFAVRRVWFCTEAAIRPGRISISKASANPSFGREIVRANREIMLFSVIHRRFRSARAFR